MKTPQPPKGGVAELVGDGCFSSTFNIFIFLKMAIKKALRFIGEPIFSSLPL
jgi:hypothetical protein